MPARSQPVPDLAVVLPLAARGWLLFPCRPRDKTPLLREWQHIATTDPKQIQAWHEEYPGCNWGLACGADSGVWVLDGDGAQGAASLEALVDWHGGPSRQTPDRRGKGLYLYFAWPDAGRIAE